MMPAKPISFDSDMRQEAKYQTGWMGIAVTISTTSASNAVSTKKRQNKKTAPVWWLEKECKTDGKKERENKGKKEI